MTEMMRVLSDGSREIREGELIRSSNTRNYINLVLKTVPILKTNVGETIEVHSVRHLHVVFSYERGVWTNSPEGTILKVTPITGARVRPFRVKRDHWGYGGLWSVVRLYKLEEIDMSPGIQKHLAAIENVNLYYTPPDAVDEPD